MPIQLTYTPINCSFYDRLEAWATLRTELELSYYSTDGEQQQTSGRIVNLFTLEKEEFLELYNGITLRLDRLISVNGIQLPPDTHCAV